MDTETPVPEHKYLSPREIAARWSCTPSTVGRVLARAGVPRVVLGHGRNGMVRYKCGDIEAYENSRDR